MGRPNQSNTEQNESRYGLGNPNVQYTAVAWDVYLSGLALVLLPIVVLLLLEYDLSLAGYQEWLLSLFG